VAIGEHVLDLAAALDDPVFAAASLNPFLAQGRPRWREARTRITELLTDECHHERVERALHRLDAVHLLLPFEVADFVDFYASEHHALNIGRMFRPDSDPLTPNWKHLPIGYHGRAGTVVASGTPITRPRGQRKAPNEQTPTFGPSRRLDFEAEVGFVVGAGSVWGASVGVEAFADHVFGVCLVNDWSSRDLQAWEYVPLGPFLGKSFATSVSPWIVPLDALEHARVPGPARDPEPLPYLRDDEHPWGLDLAMEVRLNGEVVSRPPFTSMYWTAAQQLAHMTANGGALVPATVRLRHGQWPEPHERGSLMELSWGGREPFTLADGSARWFLEDGDEVTITATAPGADGVRLGFGEVSGRIEPADG
jgi:fumarylacetoacetase